MAEVVAADRHTGPASSVGSMTVPHGPVFNMVSNPDFTFPIQPQSSKFEQVNKFDQLSRRPVSASLHIDLPRSDAVNAHRRAVSTLPSFAFNAADSSGLQEDEAPPRTPEENEAMTPSRRGHRRGGSEFVGGDSRLGVSSALSSSPTKTSALPEVATLATGAPPGRRGHAHRRSAAISNHDLSKLMQPSADFQPRLSCSLPNTPLEHPTDSPIVDALAPSPAADSEVSDPFGPSSEPTPASSSRPRVGFSDNVEFIPRPLSTISSDTESSISTIRGHSVNNSISSVLSLSTASPPSTRTPTTVLETTQEDVPKTMTKSSFEISKRIEKEGQWLRRRSSELVERPLSEPTVAPPKITFTDPEPSVRRHRRSLSHALGFDRRRSEPLMSINACEPSRLSAISLQESSLLGYTLQDAQHPQAHEIRSSAKKIKDWAASKLSKKPKEAAKALTTSSSTSSIRPESAGSITVPGRVPLSEPPVAETDLDAVFSSQDDGVESQRPLTPAQSRVEVMVPTSFQYNASQFGDPDESDAVLDLDAALGPFKTPPIGSHKQRRELHSSRLNKDFNGPGGHYHRRSESAPSLPPFEESKISLPGMADVSEEEEDDATGVNQSLGSGSLFSPQETETGIGIQIVDVHTAEPATSLSSEPDDGLDILQSWDSERSTLSRGTSRPMFSNIVSEKRGSSVIEDTIMEEPGYAEDVEIVEADEEPRSSSQTKSSDSSETPTVVATQIATLTLPDGQRSLMTPETYQTSTFSSPALRQGSFDTNRLDTSASSITDNRTLSSFATGDHLHELRVSVEVPSLTSSRSTMISSVPGNNSRRDFSNADRSLSTQSQMVDLSDARERRRKRGSIQSLSQLVTSPFGTKARGFNDSRPETSNSSATAAAPKKEHRLKKLMFWKSKDSFNRSSLPAS